MKNNRLMKNILVSKKLLLLFFLFLGGCSSATDLYQEGKVVYCKTLPGTYGAKHLGFENCTAGVLVSEADTEELTKELKNDEIIGKYIYVYQKYNDFSNTFYISEKKITEKLETKQGKTLEINISKYDKFHFEDGDPEMAWSYINTTINNQELHDIMKYWLSEDIRQIIKLKQQGFTPNITWKRK